MAQQTINIGAAPDDDTGDPLRTAFDKCNDNFDELYAASGGNPTESIIIACSDETTAITTGTAKVTFRMPYAFTLSAVRASVTTAPTGSTDGRADRRSRHVPFPPG